MKFAGPDVDALAVDFERTGIKTDFMGLPVISGERDV